MLGFWPGFLALDRRTGRGFGGGGGWGGGRGKRNTVLQFNRGSFFSQLVHLVNMQEIRRKFREKI